MRPLFVILLVAGAVAALLFALTSITGNPADSGSEGLVPPAQGTVAAGRPPADLELPAGMASPLTAEATPPRAVVDTGEETQVASDGFIEGLVVDSAQAAVAGARIQLIRQKGSGAFMELQLLISDRPAPRPIKEAETSEEGTFRFDRVPAGSDWALVVTHASYSRKVVSGIQVRPTGGTSERIELDEGFEIYGVVYGPGKNPLAGARLVLDNPAAAFMPSARTSPDRLEAVSGLDGSYAIKNIPPANRALTVTLEGYATQIDQRSVTFAGTQERRKRVDIDMMPGYPIAGRVIGPDQAGVPGVQIEAIGSGTPASRGSAISKQGGEFLITDLAEGRYTLRVVADGFDRDPLQADANDRDVLIQLSARGGLMGVVVDADGALLRDYRLTVRGLHPTNVAFGPVHGEQTVSGSKDGSFVVGGLKPGSYVVQADARGYASSFSDAAVVEEGLTTPNVVVRMSRGGTIVGIVVDMSSKTPIAGAKVTTNTTGWLESDFTNLLDAMTPTALTRVTATTNAEGRFEIRLVTPEKYQLRVKHEGFTEAIVNEVEATADVVTDIGLIALTQGATIRGTAYLASGEPATGARVALRPLDGDGTYHSVASKTDANGRYLLANVAAGRYALSCAAEPKPGQSPLIVVVDMERSRVEIQVSDGEELVQDLYLGGN
ncbi:MAG: carboxypeptidase-like regulatory domain-containing protein [Planctomycetota bacterium]